MSDEPSTEAEYARQLDERAEQIREAFRSTPGFLETLAASQEEEAEGQLLSLDEVRAEWDITD